MNDYGLDDNAFINSLVGEGTTFHGEINLDGLLRIDGDFVGVINTPGTVLIGKNGRAESTIKAETVVVGGVVKGNIDAGEKVVILSTGMLIGNVAAPRLIVEEGVLLDGNCVIRAKNNKQSSGNRGAEKPDDTPQEDEPSRDDVEDKVRWKE